MPSLSVAEPFSLTLDNSLKKKKKSVESYESFQQPKVKKKKKKKKDFQKTLTNHLNKQNKKKKKKKKKKISRDHLLNPANFLSHDLVHIESQDNIYLSSDFTSF